MSTKTSDLESLLTSLKKDTDLDKFLDSNKDILDTITFSEYFNNICKEKNIKKSILIIDSNMSRSYCYEVLRGDKIPDRDNALKLCLAAKLNLDETNRVLKLTNNGLLYPKITRDSIIIFCISKGYTLMQLDYLLYEKGQQTLCKE